MDTKIDVAYFSMEFAFDTLLPTYAGGLGVLAADAMYACADLGIPAVGVSLVYHFDDDTRRAFDPSRFMRLRPERVSVKIENRTVHLAIWQMDITGASGHIVPAYFLSSYLPENKRWDRDLTKHLYADDRYTRLGQEAILGIGGVRALHALGHTNVATYHMNEGHSALLTLELLRQFDGNEDEVRKRCTFTTHTPIPAGHDYFDYSLVQNTLRGMLPHDATDFTVRGTVGMTELGLHFSKKANAVSEKHRTVCERMFPGQAFETVTNAVHHRRWTGIATQELFDRHLSDWTVNPAVLARAPDALPSSAAREAHRREKHALVGWINAQRYLFPFADVGKDDYFRDDILTIGFARRFVPYKRPDLIFKHIDWLREASYKKLQLVFAAHCHPDDTFCNRVRASIEEHAHDLRGQVRIAMIPDYNLEIAKRLVIGCDVWLNNPLPPREASGTSGMKAALNGALNLSELDGWWVEGLRLEPQSGWGFGGEVPDEDTKNIDERDEGALIASLKDAVDCYYHHTDEWIERAKHAIALGAHFNTHRMVREYQEKMWRPS